MDSFFSNGKVILLGEYGVLHGADALCLPLKVGQKLQVTENQDGIIHWKWTYADRLLAKFSLESTNLNATEAEQGNPKWAQDLLVLIREENPDFLKDKGFSLHFTNFFPPEWGLGSSSATISSLCRLAKVNPYLVNQKLMGGSGADIACTTARQWFLYRKDLLNPCVWPLTTPYHLKNHTYFIYSGTKQPTASHLNSLAPRLSQAGWLLINDYVYRFIASPLLPEALSILQQHEEFVGEHIGQTPRGEEFPDFPGKIKSLGAWGGDFFMAISQQDYSFVKGYFQRKGYQTVFSWKDFTQSTFF